FYVSAVVNDETPRDANSVDNIELADSVQFALDLKHDISGIKALPDKTHEFIMGAVRGRTALMHMFASGRGRSPVSGGQLAIRRVGNRTIYEAAIPWSELGGGKPRDGAVFGLAVQINDSEGVRKRTLEWPDGTKGMKDPSKFLAVRLIK